MTKSRLVFAKFISRLYSYLKKETISISYFSLNWELGHPSGMKNRGTCILH